MSTGFNKRVTIQEGEVVRNRVGEVIHSTFADVAGMESIPAVVMPTIDERRQERFAEDANHWTIVLAGHWPDINQTHYVVDADGNRYEVARVSTTKGKRVTTVLARLGTITGATTSAVP